MLCPFLDVSCIKEKCELYHQDKNCQKDYTGCSLRLIGELASRKILNLDAEEK